MTGAIGKSIEKRDGEFLVLATVQLYGGKTGEFDGITDLLDGLVDEDADFLDVRRQFPGDRLGGLGRDITRTLGIKDEADRARARFDRDQRVVEVRDPADFDPGHKDSCQLSVISYQL